jgi:hypothetical protein
MSGFHLFNAVLADTVLFSRSVELRAQRLVKLRR